MSCRRIFFLIASFFCFLHFSRADPGPMWIWFTNAGVPGNDTSWQQETFPIGNGKLAAMIPGAIGSEQIQFNEDTIWGGEPHDYTNPNANLALMQGDCFSRMGDTPITTVEDASYLGTPIQHGAYQDPGSLVLTFPQSTGSNYLRSLDLNTALANVTYTYGGITYSRDIFASAPSNRVIVLHFTASQPNSITFSCSFTTPQTATYYTVNNDLVMHASVTAYDNSDYGLPNEVLFDARVRMIATGGTVSTTSSSISVTNANDVVLLLSVASNVNSFDDLTANYVTICSNNVAGAAVMGFTALRFAQTNDYENLFNRVVLDLGGNSRTNWGIGYRKQQIAVDGNDPQLVALDFQLGRYLMISGSRPGSQALNLQGKWNDNNDPSWRSEMTININEEMNYWGAEVANLSECTSPLFDMMNDLTVTGGKVATNMYHSTGWVVHHDTDLWRGAAPCNGIDGTWPTGAAWLCQHVWWHYLFTGNTNWLATNGYPLMKGAAQFFQGFLVKDPNYPNWMVTCPSYSPEHDEATNPATIATNSIAIVPSPTMDNDLLRDLFSHVIAATQILGVDGTFSTNINTLMNQLPPDQIGKGGQLQEWLEDVDLNSDLEQRHCSHLVGFFPGDEISTYYTPALASAAYRSIGLRGYANSTLTPWSISWRVNLRDRLQDGDGAWTNLLFIYGYGKVGTNLVFADIPNRQLDSIFGRLSGIACMFLQSPRGEVILLPALPTQLTNGMVTGLCAAGGFEVDNLTWTNHQFTGATILSTLGNVCNLRSKWPIVVEQGGNPVAAPMVLPGLYQFSTLAGSNYTILPATIAEAENLTATTSGGSLQVVTNAAFSNWRASQFNATAAGNSVTYTVTNVAAGTYHLYIVANANTNCGQFQLSCGPVGGSLTNVGTIQDTYSSTNVAYLLPIRVTTATNVIGLWTNMQTEYDCSNWTAATTGNYNFTLTVAGKNAASSGYGVTVDYIKFAPAATVVAYQLPLTPTNLAPAAGAAGLPTAPTLQTTAFIDPNGGGMQSASEWTVQRMSDNVLVFDSSTDTVDTTSITLPANVLNYDTSYSWQARYADNFGLWSSYSAATTFTTIAPAINYGFQTGSIVLSWPTNTSGFELESTTNLMSNNWQPVLSTPAMAGNYFIITNFPAGASVFFRLSKP
jgi:alpha-L-fucosidase 2